MIDISVIVRFRNEAAFLETTLQAIRDQRLPGERVEIVAVDDSSHDGSRGIAARHADLVLCVNEYSPGKALNYAIGRASGRYIAVLSAHAIPANDEWLVRLRACMDRPRVAGAYGGQLYNLHSRFLDKRDLDIFSTLDGRVETHDSDFWNANSMFPRALWERQRFDESVFELEDHYWTKLTLPRGFEVHFEPRALVYHYSHIDRIDREFLPSARLGDRETIDAAISELNSPAADWPRVMCAGLTLSSLTHVPEIRRAVHPIGRHLAQHSDFDVRWRMAQALGKLPSAESADYLIDALRDASFYPRDEAAWSLGRLGGIASTRLEAAIETLPVFSRPFAALALGRSGVLSATQMATEILSVELDSDDPMRRRNGAYFAGELADVPGTRRLVPKLGKLLSGDGELCKVGCWALGCFARSRDPVIEWGRVAEVAREHEDQLVRFEAIVAIGKRARGLCDMESLGALESGCTDPAGRVRYGAVQSLRLLAEDGEPISTRELDDQDPEFGVRFEIALIVAANLRATSSPAETAATTDNRTESPGG